MRRKPGDRSSLVLVIPTKVCRQIVFCVFVICLFISAGMLFQRSARVNVEYIDYVVLMTPDETFEDNNTAELTHFSPTRVFKRRRKFSVNKYDVHSIEPDKVDNNKIDAQFDNANLATDTHLRQRLSTSQLREDYALLSDVLLSQPANYTLFGETLKKSAFAALLASAGFPISELELPPGNEASDIFSSADECVSRSSANSASHSVVFSHPQIAHFVRFFKNPNKLHIDFLQFSSILSVARIFHARRIILHTNYEPIHDVYYNILRHVLPCQFRWHHIEPKRYISNHRVWFVEHESDLAKLELLYNYGGIALDFDVIAVNATRLADKQGGHDCVISADDNNHLNIGFISCAPKSPYVRTWIDGYANDYRSWGWVYNSAVLPYSMLSAARGDTQTANDSVNSFEKVNENGEFQYDSADSGARPVYIEQMMSFPGYNTRGLWMLPDGVPGWRRYMAVHHMLKIYLLNTQVDLKADSDVLFIRAAIGEIIRNVYNLVL